MPDLQGTNIAAPVRPYNSECTYPTAYAEEIAGGLKYVETESALASIPPERRPVGTVASVGFGKFRQWTGTSWRVILQGFALPTVAYSQSEVRLNFGESPVPLRAVGSDSAGVMLPAMFKRLMGHGKKHLQDGDDPIASRTPGAEKIPQSDKYGKLASGWLPAATALVAGTVCISADAQTNGTTENGYPVVLRANDSRLAKIPDILERLEMLGSPVRYIETLPTEGATNSQTFFCRKETGELFLWLGQKWLSVGGGLPGSDGKTAYEVAQIQGFSGSIDQWLEGLKGADGLDGIDGERGKNAYELACSAGYKGTENQWLDSLRGLDGTNGVDGRNGVNGKTVYELALENGFIGSLDSWLQTLRGENGQDGAEGNDGKTAYTLACEEGFIGTQTEWLASLHGTPGRDGTNGIDGQSAYEQARDAGFSGTVQEWLLSLKGETGQDGINGLSAYEIALDAGFSGSSQDWLASLKGVPGTQGENGEAGKSAYALAVEAGFVGTQTEWLASLHGATGRDGTNGSNGKSAYELALTSGFVGDVNAWLASLIGPKGEKGDPGERGESGDGGLSDTELDAILRSRVSAWFEENLPNILETLLPELLETSFASHVSGYHQWQPM